MPASVFNSMKPVVCLRTLRKSGPPAQVRMAPAEKKRAGERADGRWSRGRGQGGYGSVKQPSSGEKKACQAI